jgi:hypothetical protein
MKRHTSDTLQSLGVSSVTTSVTKALPQKFITLDEVAYEASRLLFLSVPNIIGEIQVFTGLDARDLNGNIASLRRPYYKSPKKSYRVEGKGSKVKSPLNPLPPR